MHLLLAVAGTMLAILSTTAVDRFHRAPSLVVRHDVPLERFEELARDLGVAVGQLRARDSSGIVVSEGTLVAPRWVLTAAHSVARNAGAMTFRIDGRTYQVVDVQVHPEWNGVFEDLHDIAVLKLVADVERANPAPLYRGAGELGQQILLVGRGMFGDGRTGPTSDDGTLRAATNRIDDVGPLHLMFTFDAPGSGREVDLEGVSGPGDSGGPALLKRGNVLCVAGVSSAQDDEPTNGREGQYGVLEYYSRVSSFVQWIEQITGPLPRAAACDS